MNLQVFKPHKKTGEYLGKWRADLLPLRHDFAQHLISLGKSHETARLYALRVCAWLDGEMESMEFIDDAKNLSERKIRRAALMLLEQYKDYTIDRPIDVPVVEDREGWLRPRLDEFCKWLDARGIRPRSRDAYRGYAMHAIQSSNYMWWLADAPTQNTRNRRIVALKVVRRFNKQNPDKALPIAVGTLPPTRNEERKPPVYMTKEEVYRLGTSLKYQMGSQVYAIWALTYGCGLRAMEIKALKMKDIIFGERGHVRVVNSKRGRSRSVPMPTQTQAALLEFMQTDRRNLDRLQCIESVFLSQRGNSLNMNILRRRLHVQYEKIGLAVHQPLHMYRWLFATHLAEQMREQNGSVDWEALQSLLGHRSITTTMLYVGEIQLDALGRIIDGISPLGAWMHLAEYRRAMQEQLAVVEPSGQSPRRLDSGPRLRGTPSVRSLA